MNPGISLSQKFLLVLGGAAVLALVLVGAAFFVLLDSYHRSAADRELKESFELIAADMRQRDRRLQAVAENLVQHRDVISIANLLNKYQDPQDYQPLTFDGEKRKLAQLLAERTLTADHSYSAIFMKGGELTAFAYHDHDTPTISGIQSYRGGVPVPLIREGTAGFHSAGAIPAIGSVLAPPVAGESPQHTYRMVSGKLVRTIALPIVRKLRNGAGETIGTVLAVDILDDHFIDETMKLVGHDFALLTPGNTIPPDSATALAGLLAAVPEGPLPGLFDVPGAFHPLGDDSHYAGGAKIPLLGGGRAALLLGVDRQGFLSGIEALQKSILLALVITALVVLPLGGWFIRRTLTGPVRQLMAGVDALSRQDGQAVIGLDSRDELGSLAQAFNAMAATIHSRERDLTASRDQLRLITDNLPLLITYNDIEWRFRFVNKTCAEWYARPVSEIVGQLVSDILGKGFERLAPHMEQAYQGHTTTFEETLAYPDGVTRTILGSYIPHRKPGGTVQGFFAMVTDISDAKRAEEQLRQAQKMEAVGQLTGGIAHDFNNLLAIIMGNAEFLDADKVEGQERMTQAILKASARGAELTQRLLAFSRRQPLKPQATDLRRLTDGMSDLLRRTLGETVAMEIISPPDLWPAMADHGQMENALLNLALNARQAMPGGGRLIIECSNITLDEEAAAAYPEAAPGNYAVLAVSDNGAGMSREVMEHAFEPFFTTKGVGEGSGLGLSMVYGFVRQSGGHVIIYSEEGRGTSVKLFLPRAGEHVSSNGAADAGDIPMGAGQTVLVVEDDADVGAMVVRMATSLGYEVIDAPQAARARELLQDGRKVDLILTDVVLPGGVSGPEFAAEACAHDPGLKVVFMSGYPADMAVPRGMVDRQLLSKPFKKSDLAHALYNALHAPPQTAGGASP